MCDHVRMVVPAKLPKITYCRFIYADGLGNELIYWIIFRRVVVVVAAAASRIRLAADFFSRKDLLEITYDTSRNSVCVCVQLVRVVRAR